MNVTYGSRDIVRNPSLLRIDADKSFVVEDKKARKRLGIYIGVDLAEEFFRYLRKERLLKSAKRVKERALIEYRDMEGTIDDGL